MASASRGFCAGGIVLANMSARDFGMAFPLTVI
jgi:hypothetical protein